MRICEAGHESPAIAGISAAPTATAGLTRGVSHRLAAADLGFEATVGLAVALPGGRQFPQPDHQLRIEARLLREGNHDAHAVPPSRPVAGAAWIRCIVRASGPGRAVRFT